MPTVRIVQTITGARDGVEWPKVGELLQVPQEELDDLVRMGLARAVEVKAAAVKVERAVARKPETRKG